MQYVFPVILRGKLPDNIEYKDLCFFCCAPQLADGWGSCQLTAPTLASGVGYNEYIQTRFGAKSMDYDT